MQEDKKKETEEKLTDGMDLKFARNIIVTLLILSFIVIILQKLFS